MPITAIAALITYPIQPIFVIPRRNGSAIPASTPPTIPVTKMTRNSAKMTVSIAMTSATAAQIPSTITDRASTRVTNVPHDPKKVITNIPNFRSTAHMIHNTTPHTAIVATIFVVSRPATVPITAPITAPVPSPIIAESTLTSFRPNNEIITPTTTIAISTPIISGVFPATNILVGPSAELKTDVKFSIFIPVSPLPLITL